jgi:hypothetical protein
MLDLTALWKADFEVHLNDVFSVLPGSGHRIPFRLDRVSEAQSRGTQTLSLFFYGPGDILLKQMLYTMEHDNMGQLQLFIVPVGEDEKGICYQAIMTRFLQ